MPSGGLVLPEPARTLWIASRETIRRALDAIGAEQYRLGGGTVLAARWQHRISFDVDINVDPAVDLRRLDGPEHAWFRREMGRLGAVPSYSAELNLYNLRFGEAENEQAIQLWGHPLPLSAGHQQQVVGSSREFVLSSVTVRSPHQSFGDPQQAVSATDSDRVSSRFVHRAAGDRLLTVSHKRLRVKGFRYMSAGRHERCPSRAGGRLRFRVQRRSVCGRQVAPWSARGEWACGPAAANAEEAFEPPARGRARLTQACAGVAGVIDLLAPQPRPAALTGVPRVDTAGGPGAPPGGHACGRLHKGRHGSRYLSPSSSQAAASPRPAREYAGTRDRARARDRIHGDAGPSGLAGSDADMPHAGRDGDGR